MAELNLSNYINGESVTSASGERIDLVDPSTGDIRRARVRRRHRCGPTAPPPMHSGWRDATPIARQKAMLAIADVLEEHDEELVDLESLNTGKPVAVTMSEEIPPMIDQIRFFAGAARLLEGRGSAEYMEGFTSWIRREPVGVIGQVAPWNYPMMMAVWKFAQAIAAGNTVVIKPSDTTPVSTIRMAELIGDILPAGVLNVVAGDRETGRALVEHKRPDMVAITGSVRAGMQVAESAPGT
jgi:betaine-aldehyde dehydrogenase